MHHNTTNVCSQASTPTTSSQSARKASGAPAAPTRRWEALPAGSAETNRPGCGVPAACCVRCYFCHSTAPTLHHLSPAEQPRPLLQLGGRHGPGLHQKPPNQVHRLCWDARLVSPIIAVDMRSRCTLARLERPACASFAVAPRSADTLHPCRPDNWNVSTDFIAAWISSHMNAARAMGKVGRPSLRRCPCWPHCCLRFALPMLVSPTLPVTATWLPFFAPRSR